MKILIVKMSSLGDILHALPAVHRLRHHVDAEIHWVAHPVYRGILECCDDVARVIDYPRDRFFRELPAFLRSLRTESYDLVLDLQGLFKSGMTARLARGRRYVGPAFSREAARLFYAEQAGPAEVSGHAVEQLLEVVAHFQCPQGPVTFPLHFPRVPLPEHTGKAVAVFPFTRWPTKNIPAAWLTPLLTQLTEQVSVTCFVMGAPGDQQAAEQLVQQVGPSARNLCGQTDLVGMGSLLQEVDAVVTGDTGPMHMAAALEKPVTALFGPTDAQRTGPYGAQHRVFSVDLPCRPCFSRTCRLPDQAWTCMHDQPAKDVVSHLAALLGQTGDSV